MELSESGVGIVESDLAVTTGEELPEGLFVLKGQDDAEVLKGSIKLLFVDLTASVLVKLVELLMSDANGSVFSKVFEGVGRLLLGDSDGGSGGNESEDGSELHFACGVCWFVLYF